MDRPPLPPRNRSMGLNSDEVLEKPPLPPRNPTIDQNRHKVLNRLPPLVRSTSMGQDRRGLLNRPPAPVMNLSIGQHSNKVLNTSSQSLPVRNQRMDMDRDEMLDAFQRAKDLNLCPNRLWAVVGEDLPKVFPDCDLTPVVGDTIQEHEECTALFCEYSLRDFTAVEQRHECKDADGIISEDCMQIRNRFPSDLRDRAALEGKPTVWNLAGNAMLEYPRPYMAISHVWADGTGTGAWQAGTVNGCLYAFFENIAKHYSCEGIWWDTLCIPREKAARTLAIQKMEKSYEDARITLVHDCFLRNWEWDPQTACFAIIMSPWFSRGWTALELKKSRKVKVIFKGHSSPVIKDLDEEILARPDDPEGPRKAASRIIQNLRKDASSFTLNDLLTILRSRYTSWPKDMAVISALLVGLTPEGRQQETYRKIAQNFGFIAPGHLFHYTVTMSKGLSWCPTSLFDMPPDPGNASLTLCANGDLEGRWRVLPADRFADLEERCLWGSIHPLIKREIQVALRRNWKCQLLAECGKKPAARALLVGETGTPNLFQYIGALSFRQAFGELESTWVEKIVIISGSQLEDRLSSPRKNPDPHAIQMQKKPFDVNKDVSYDITSETHLLHTAIWRGEYESFLDLIQRTDLSITDALGKGPLHLAAERGHPRMIQDLALNVDLNLQCSNGQTALHSAAWGGSTAVVAGLLQTDIDIRIRDKHGNLALHTAAQIGHIEAFKLLLLDDLDVRGQNLLTPLHFAAIHGHGEIVELLYGADLEARDSILGWNPLHCAVDNGNIEIVKLLIQRGADVNAVDHHMWWTPLHIAMMNGHTEITRLLFEKGAAKCCDKVGWMPHYFAEANGHTEILNLVPKDAGSSNLSSAKNIEWTPLHCRAINKQPGLSKLLVEEGAEIYVQPKTQDWSEIEFAAKNNLSAAIKFLLERGEYSNTTHRVSLLHDASRHGYEAALRTLLNAGLQVDVDSQNENGLTPLHLASQQGHEGIVQILLEAGADKDAMHRHSGQRPLHVAAFEGHVGVARLLLEAGANRDARSHEIGSPVIYAIMAGHENCVRFLINASTDSVRATFEEGYFAEERSEPLWKAIAFHKDEIAKILLISGAMGNIESRFEPYATKLHMAVDMQNTSIVEFLLQSGANPNSRIIPSNDSAYVENAMMPLHVAALKGCDAIIKLLLNAGADIMAEDEEGRTPLHLASEKTRNANCIPLLLSSGAEINARDNHGRTALHSSCQFEGHTVKPLAADRIRALLEAGPDLELRDKVGNTALCYAARGKISLQLFLDAGADVEARGSRGETALWSAIRHRAPLALRALIEAGVDIEARDHHVGQTALIFAAMHSANPYVIAQLLAGGASVKARDNKGNTALFYAQKIPYTNAWKLLRDAEKRKGRLWSFQDDEAQQSYDEYLSLDYYDGFGGDSRQSNLKYLDSDPDESDDESFQYSADDICDEIRASLQCGPLDVDRSNPEQGTPQGNIEYDWNGGQDDALTDDIRYDPNKAFEFQYGQRLKKRNRLSRLVKRVQAHKSYDEHRRFEEQRTNEILGHVSDDENVKRKGLMRIFKSGSSGKDDDHYH